MMRAHQPGSQPLDIPEAIPNPAVPQPAPAPSPAPREPVEVPAPQGAVRSDCGASQVLRAGEADFNSQARRPEASLLSPRTSEDAA